MRKKYAMLVGTLALTIAMATGCTNEPDAADKQTIPNTEIKPEETDVQQQGNMEEKPQNADTNEDTPTEGTNQETIFIGGKVRNVTEDSCTISRTLLDDGIVTMPEEGSPEEELVTIRYTDSTTFEHWTIQGGGAGIVKREASFSEIQEGCGLEANGYFDEEGFVAEKIIIEVYE